MTRLTSSPFPLFSKLSFRTLFFLLVLAAFFVRLYKLNTPLADWHSFRQADTASVTREYIKHGIDLLHPKYHDLSNIQSGENFDGKDNTEGWRMVEFPIVNGVLALFLRTFPFLNLVIISRLASIFASLISLVALVSLVRRVYGDPVALTTGILFAFLPYSIYYSRVILPEPFFLAVSLVSLHCYQTFLLKKRTLMLPVSILFFSLALLIKPMAVFFIPVFLGIRFAKDRKIVIQDFLIALLYLLSFLPLLWWREWIKQYAIGIPISAWLFNGVGKGTNLSPVYMIRFRPAWWRWLFYERLTKLFLGYAGVIPFVASWGIFVDRFNPKRFSGFAFFLSWAIGAFAYISIFAAGNVQHDYYQIPLIPFVVLAFALGLHFLAHRLARFLPSPLLAISLALLVSVSLSFAWRQVKGYYNINNPDIILAGTRADILLPPAAKVIAPYGGDTAFLFQTNRTGWPLGFGIDTKIAEGATHYVSVNYDDETNALLKKYQTVEATSHYAIIDLTKPLVPFAPAMSNAPIPRR